MTGRSFVMLIAKVQMMIRMKPRDGRWEQKMSSGSRRLTCLLKAGIHLRMNSVILSTGSLCRVSRGQSLTKALLHIRSLRYVNILRKTIRTSLQYYAAAKP